MTAITRPSLRSSGGSVASIGRTWLLRRDAFDGASGPGGQASTPTAFAGQPLLEFRCELRSGRASCQDECQAFGAVDSIAVGKCISDHVAELLFLTGGKVQIGGWVDCDVVL